MCFSLHSSDYIIKIERIRIELCQTEQKQQQQQLTKKMPFWSGDGFFPSWNEDISVKKASDWDSFFYSIKQQCNANKISNTEWTKKKKERNIKEDDDDDDDELENDLY